MKILCIGDSNTYGYDPRSYIGSRYPEEVRWTARLKADLIAELNAGTEADVKAGNGTGTSSWTETGDSTGSSGTDLINCGVNGLKIPRDPSISARLIRIHNPDLIIVMLGTNDLCGGASAEQAAERIEKYLLSIASFGKQVLLISPPHLQCGDWVMDGEAIEESLELGELYREVADRTGALFADAGEWDIDIAFDGVHFSPEGHVSFAHKIGDIIRTLRKSMEGKQ